MNLWLEEAEIRGRFEGNLARWPASAFGRGPRGLPVNGGDERFEAYSADDLFEGAVVAVRRDEEGADRDLRGVFEVFAGQPAQAEAACSSSARMCASWSP